MQWGREQDAALSAVADWMTSSEQLFRLFGYAGTGKTTLARHLAAHIDGEVGGTFGQSIFLIQVMDSDESARALAKQLGRADSNQQGAIVSKVLVNDRLVGTYTGDPSHATAFTDAFKHL